MPICISKGSERICTSKGSENWFGLEYEISGVYWNSNGNDVCLSYRKVREKGSRNRNSTANKRAGRKQESMRAFHPDQKNPCQLPRHSEWVDWFCRWCFNVNRHLSRKRISCIMGTTTWLLLTYKIAYFAWLVTESIVNCWHWKRIPFRKNTALAQWTLHRVLLTANSRHSV